MVTGDIPYHQWFFIASDDNVNPPGGQEREKNAPNESWGPLDTLTCLVLARRKRGL